MHINIYALGTFTNTETYRKRHAVLQFLHDRQKGWPFPRNRHCLALQQDRNFSRKTAASPGINERGK